MSNKVIIKTLPPNSLQHYGVKGMKWGVRRTQEELGKDVTINSLEGFLLGLGVTIIFAAGRSALSNVGNKDVEKIHSNEDLKVKSLKDVKKLQPPETLSQSLKNTNNVKSFNKSYKNNCPNTTMAYELRRRGYDVKAKPAAIGETTEDIRKSYNINEKDVLTIKNLKRIGNNKSSTQKLKEHFDSTPDNYRGAVIVTWSGISAAGHIFNVEKNNGKVMFVDAQSGKSGEFKGLSLVNTAMQDVTASLGVKSLKNNPANYLNKSDSVEIFRLDNVKINEKELERRIIKG